MKKLILLSSALVALTACTSKQAGNTDEAAPTRSLVVYYSQTGATRQVAELLAAKTGADLDSVVAEVPYGGTFDETIARCLKEQQEGTQTAVKALSHDVANYDTLYVGYPVWFGTMAPPMASFVKSQTLDGKVIIPFCTFGSGGLETSANDLKAAQPNATYLEGYGIRNARVASASAELDEYLIRTGILAGEVEALPAYADATPVDAEKQAIFDAACGSYPMPLGKPVTVATRTLADKTQYCFTVESMGRDGQPAQAQIIVEQSGEQSPEFIKAIR